jgi:hypothetical protein
MLSPFEIVKEKLEEFEEEFEREEIELWTFYIKANCFSSFINLLRSSFIMIIRKKTQKKPPKKVKYKM